MMARDLGISENVTFLGELPSGRAIRDQLDSSDDLRDAVTN